MFLNRIYYLLKPILPWGLRTALRRRRARTRRLRYSMLWPINARAGETPPNWPGWPGGKRFAFVLTHDVEGSKGLARVEELMKLEMKYGFRSCFNFVPEREYSLPDELRRALQSAGFEVGVHGLHHDGKLYSSKAEFARRAARIREYLASWGACGFRSPLMQHKLPWMHLLGAEHDSSTFDTDPFEPEPDGAGTIFPFWVPAPVHGGPQGSGFVELPYTLPQDFGLFVILQERNIDIWKRKLDWIAERGGMALLNTHPDYTCFSGQPGRDEFPAAWYEEFLAYAREKYAGESWHALPREVSDHYRAVPEAERNTRKKICMVAYTDYENDNRVRRYAEALAKRGDQVEVIALSGGITADPPGTWDVNGVTVHRIQNRALNERRKFTYAWRLLKFLVASSRFLARRHKEAKFDLIHVHNIPDFLVFAAWYAKWAGAKVILDIHDIVPELFANKFGGNERSLYVELLERIEAAATKFADHVIISNHLWMDKLVERSVAREKCSVYVNHVDPSLFHQRPRTRDDGKFVILFPGTWQWHQGLDIAIDAMAYLKEEAPHAELHLYGAGNGGIEKELAAQVERLGLQDRVKFCGAVSLEQIPEIVANADLGVVPKRADSFGNEAYSTKIMEFLSQGVPTVVSRTKIDTFYFDEETVRFFRSGDSRALADAILDLMRNPDLYAKLRAKGLEYVAEHSWDRKKHEYLELVDTLTTEQFPDLAALTGRRPLEDPVRIARKPTVAEPRR